MKYQLTSRQMSSVIGDEVVILNHAAGIYYSLDAVGAFVWQQLQQSSQSANELVENVCNHFEVEASVCSIDIENLLNNLIKEKLVETII